MRLVGQLLQSKPAAERPRGTNPLHVAAIASLLCAACGDSSQASQAVGACVPSDAAGADAGAGAAEDDATALARRRVEEGRRIFRFDTFGDEAFWGGKLRLHQAIEGAAHGGVGPGVSPKTALAVGLKVDSEALPPSVLAQLRAGQIDLDDPASTLALLRANAVVGVTGAFAQDGTLSSVGIQCALCHSTVDDSVAPGIGKRRDGWANRDLDVGAIVGLAPDLSPFTAVLGADDATVRKVLASWGPGRFDAELILDGKAFRDDGKTAATLIPPAFGLAGANLHTWTGWGSVPEWNAFVAVLEMHGKGSFADFRLADAQRFPVAAKNGFDRIVVPAAEDLVASKLPALQAYQLSLDAPAAPAGSFDRAAADRGAALFAGKAKCASCHVPPLYTESGFNAHRAEDIGIDDFQAKRGPIDAYRTSPLRGLTSHQKGGFYHDGRFATLGDVVAHYDEFMRLGLGASEKADLVEYLKSL